MRFICAPRSRAPTGDRGAHIAWQCVDCTEEASDGDACVDVFVILEGSKLLRME